MEDKLFGKILMVLALASGIYGNYLQRQQNSLAQQQLDAQVRANPLPPTGDVKQEPPSPSSGDSRVTGYILQYGSSVVLVFGLLVAIGAIQFREPDPNKLIIHYARYSRGTRRWEYRNVTGILRAHIHNNNSIDVIAGNAIFGDPFPHKNKYTLLKYSLGGVTRVVSIPEGDRLTIQALSSPPTFNGESELCRIQREEIDKLNKELEPQRIARALEQETIGLLRTAPKLWVDYKPRGHQPIEMEALVFTKEGSAAINEIRVGDLTWNVKRSFPVSLHSVVGFIRTEPVECKFTVVEQKGNSSILYELPGLIRDMMREYGVEAQPSADISYKDEQGNRFCRTFVLSIDPYDRIVWEPGPVRLLTGAVAQ